MKIVEVHRIPDKEDADDAAHGNCLYLESNGTHIPLYFDNDKMTVWIGTNNASDDDKILALKFAGAFGYELEVLYG